MFFKKKKEEPVKKKKSLKSRFMVLLLNCFVAMIAVVGLYVLTVFLQMPSLDSVLNETRLPTITFVDRAGNEIRSSNKIMGAPVTVHELPPYVWQSIVAIEDKRYFHHGAIDVRGLMRATISNLMAGRIAAGGSSITQQTAKNIFLSRDKKMSRKIQELILSYWLEDRFDKNQILDLYMNRVELVGGLRGIDAASRILFGVDANNMSLANAVQIAAMLKAPTAYSPLLYPEKNIDRAQIILKEMVRQNYITLQQARNANKQLAAARPLTDTNIYRYWTDFVTDEIKSTIGEISDDIIVHTTLDKDMQSRAAKSVADKTGEYQGAYVAMERDGALRVFVGGANYQSSQFNRVLAPRQPGSTFKTIVYLVALENGLTPDSIVLDAPITIGNYSPDNYNSRFYGEITLATAFAKSVNSVPLRLTQEYGIDSVLNMTARLGGGDNLRREFSTVLGASEMNLLNMTAMHNVIWNDGYSARPYAIERIETLSGDVLFERNPSDPLLILSYDTVTAMQDILADVVKTGTGRRANSENVIGGKTGTSNENRDAWFIGATPYLTVGVWVGRDNFTPMDKKITGGTIPAEIFKASIP